MSLKEFAVLLMICTIWGLHFPVMKLTVGQSAEPLFYAATRMTIVGILLIPKLKWHKGLMLPILVAGACYGALNYAFMFPALEMTTASAASVAIELYVPFSIVLSVLIFKDRIGLPRIAGILMALAGVALIATAGPDEVAGPQFVLGIVMVAAAAMSEAIGAILVKKVSGVGPYQLLAWFAVIGSLILWPLSLTLESNQLEAFNETNRMPILMALVYSAIAVSLIAHASYYWLLQRLEIYKVATPGLMTTVIGVGASIIILGEPLSGKLILGGVITLVGVAIILMRDRGKNKAPLPTV